MPSFFDDFSTAVNGEDIATYNPDYVYLSGSGITYDATFTPGGFAQPGFSGGIVYRSDYPDELNLTVEGGIAIVNRRATHAGIVARLDTGTLALYQLQLAATVFGQYDRSVILSRSVGGVGVTLGSYVVHGNTPPAPPTWCNLRMVLNGPQIDVYMQGPGDYPATPPSGSWNLIISVSDSVINTAGKTGLSNVRTFPSDGDGNTYNLYISADTGSPPPMVSTTGVGGSVLSASLINTSTSVFPNGVSRTAVPVVGNGTLRANVGRLKFLNGGSTLPVVSPGGAALGELSLAEMAAFLLYTAGEADGSFYADGTYGQPTLISINNPVVGKVYIVDVPIADPSGFAQGVTGQVKIKREGSAPDHYSGSVAVSAVEIYGNSVNSS